MYNEDSSGSIVTFYSYKGGVGRTMALVNSAALLAEQGKRVLIIDWDLEAPGLHKFFINAFENQKGIVDFIAEYYDAIKDEEISNEEYELEFINNNISSCIQNINLNMICIDFIQAGAFNKDYSKKLDSIGWMDLHRKSPTFFIQLTEQLEKKYDYILIDSRTGAADISGICTMELPRKLVLVFALNSQNIDGVIEVARQSIRYRANDDRKLCIYPLPSRLDNENPKELSRWIDTYKSGFENLMKDSYKLEQCKLDNYFNIVKIPYKPAHAYGENIPVIKESRDNDLFISYHYNRFVEVLDLDSDIWDLLSEDQILELESNKHFEKGIENFNSDEFEVAKFEFEKAYSLQKNSSFLPKLLFYWGYTLFKIGSKSWSSRTIIESTRKLEESIKIDGSAKDSHYCLANVYFALGKWSKDLDIIRRSIKQMDLAISIDSNRESIVKANREISLWKSVPDEIWERGFDLISHYVQQVDRDSHCYNEARIIILGDKGVGKTSLSRRIVNPTASMTREDESTAGVNTSIWTPTDKNFRVHIWDFGGHIITHAVHQFFLSERSLYIIVHDGRTDNQDSIRYWLDHMNTYGGNSEAVILLNMKDPHEIRIPVNELKEKYHIAGVFPFSIKDDQDRLATFRDFITCYIIDHPSWENQRIPYSYYHVKDQLEELFFKCETGLDPSGITRLEFDKIASENGIDDSDELLRNLHALGTCLWYPEMEKHNMLVLNPEWISNGVYSIIIWLSNMRRCAIFIDEFEKVFSSEIDQIRYPESKYIFLFDLIKHYRLGYETKSRRKMLIIPHLMENDRPKVLPEFPMDESLLAKYFSEQPLPPNTISRFIVEHNEDIYKHKGKEQVWRNGVILYDGDATTALVREEDRTISIWVKGKDKTTYFSKLRETLNVIFRSYKSDKPELDYRIVEYGGITQAYDLEGGLLLSDSKILNHAIADEPYYDDKTGKRIPLNQTVNSYNITGDALINYGDRSTIIQNTFNFHNCSVSLQGNFRDLAQRISSVGYTEEAEELTEISDLLEQAENCKNPKEFERKGIANRLKRVMKELEDENSTFHKAVKGVRLGVKIAQEIAERYNDIAQWVGWPQVPKPFL